MKEAYITICAIVILCNAKKVIRTKAVVAIAALKSNILNAKANISPKMVRISRTDAHWLGNK